MAEKMAQREEAQKASPIEMFAPYGVIKVAEIAVDIKNVSIIYADGRKGRLSQQDIEKLSR